MDGLVLPTRPREADDALTISSVPSIAQKQVTLPPQEIVSPQDVLATLKSQPSVEQLDDCLEILTSDRSVDASFHIRRPGPLASQVIFVLVSEILPAYWQSLSQDTFLRRTWRRLIKCLRSSAGIAATTNRLKILLDPNTSQPTAGSKAPAENVVEHLRTCLELLECLLHGDDTLSFFSHDIISLEQQKTRQVLTADGLIGLLAGGNVLGLAAQADTFIREKSSTIHKFSWLGDGKEFTSWLGRNVLQLSKAINAGRSEDKRFRTQALSRGLRLGHGEALLSALFNKSLDGSDEDVKVCCEIIADLPKFVQIAVLDGVLQLLSQKPMSDQDDRFVSGASALLKTMTGAHKHLLDHLVEWLVDFSGGNVGFSFQVFKAVICLVSEDLERLRNIFKTSIERFGSKRGIQQNPMLQQEVQTKILLLLTSYVSQKDQNHLKQFKSSSTYLNAISNRLAASSPRLQYLGMIVGMAVSDLVDDEQSRLKFDTEDIRSEEGQQLRALARHRDKIGTISDLKPESSSRAKSSAASIEKPVASKKVAQKPANSKIVAIEEIEDSESEDDLPVYAKPDSDPEDEDDDPTLINRNKPSAPVYIRDLLAGLRDEENYDRHKLAIEHASPLIRRKTNFGTEVSDHLEELASRLVGLRDGFDLDNFQEKRLQAMISIIMAKPVEMGQWFSNTYFNGDWSMSQRAAILSALALAARELAGFKEEDADMTGVDEVPDFPSKRLPEKYAKMYQLEAAPIAKLTGKLERDIIKPMALEAADKATGPNILKVRTFSSRMEVEKKRKRAIPNSLAKIVADGFFYPLTGRLSSVVQARGDGSVFTSPFLLSQFLRTLALILSASGASTLALPGMTAEFWSLLLSLRRYALADQSILEALLFATLTILEINSKDQRRLAEDHAKELMETQEWVQPIFQNLRGGAKEEERVKMLASALLVKVKDVIEKYQQDLLGRLQ